MTTPFLINIINFKQFLSNSNIFKIGFLAFSMISLSNKTPSYFLHVTKNYQIKRTVDDKFKKDFNNQIVFDDKIPKWNYLIKAN